MNVPSVKFRREVLTRSLSVTKVLSRAVELHKENRSVTRSTDFCFTLLCGVHPPPNGVRSIKAEDWAPDFKDFHAPMFMNYLNLRIKAACGIMGRMEYIATLLGLSASYLLAVRKGKLLLFSLNVMIWTETSDLPCDWRKFSWRKDLVLRNLIMYKVILCVMHHRQDT
jgi:hypothetical protein